MDFKRLTVVQPQPALPLPAVTIRTTPMQPNHSRPWERQSYKIETLNPSGTVLTKEMEVTYSTAFNGQLAAVSADVRHESAFAPNAPNPLKNFNFTN